MTHVNLTAYEGVESLSRFSEEGFQQYCEDKLASVDKHIEFIKNYVVLPGYEGNVLEIGSVSSKLLFRLQQEGLLEHGVGFETSQSRCRFAEKFKQLTNSHKVEVRNQNFLEAEATDERFDLIIGVDVVINLIGAIHPEATDDTIEKAISLLKPSGTLVFEFMTFEERELQGTELRLDDVYRTWKTFPEEDPFIYGLDEISLEGTDIVRWNKFFIPRSTDEVITFLNLLTPLSKNSFEKRGFSIFDCYSDNDDTADQEFLAVFREDENE